ncbi:MAG: isomerizing glutamine--fructose-6-phosphate transaminase, partial [Gammaproteobacteria bacterium]|nr:isomerizing glutamine--fructose-6-phosphate transaminase [Gammaproteobacteria bacterium]
MCGIVGVVAERNAVPILLEGLRRLEYRGYDSAGVALLGSDGKISRVRAHGKVARLEEALEASPCFGGTGIAHTRWATHGVPSERNAHPHTAQGGTLALVHNGIIENYEALRDELLDLGYEFTSETDTEVIANRIHFHSTNAPDLLTAVQRTVGELNGGYALAVISETDPDTVIVARQGAPVVLGLGIGENFVASDVSALLPVTRKFIFLEEGDVARITREAITVFDAQGSQVTRPIRESEVSSDAAERGQFRHYMLKEIYEQPVAVANTLTERISHNRVLEAAFGRDAPRIFAQVKNVDIIACGTSYHAAVVARYLIEE